MVSTSGLYVLKGKEVFRAKSHEEWGKFMECREEHFRHVKHTSININDTAYSSISTVFLGIDHNFGGAVGDPPVVFETMVFGGDLDESMDRYTTWRKAKIGHLVFVAKFDEIIRKRFKTKKCEIVDLSSKVNVYNYHLKIPSHIVFDKKLLRLIRES